MEHSIGTGAIVGIAIATNIYIYNSDYFTKSQKIGLFICFILPPAQWVLMVLFYFYNEELKNNTSIKTEEKTIENNIANLKDLLEKEILTEEEFKIKVNKLSLEKDEQNLKNSVEYKQIKNLFDSGILTEEEFNSKIQLIRKYKNNNENQTYTRKNPFDIFDK